MRTRYHPLFSRSFFVYGRVMTLVVATIFAWPIVEQLIRHGPAKVRSGIFVLTAIIVAVVAVNLLLNRLKGRWDETQRARDQAKW